MFKCRIQLVIFGIDDDYESWILLKDGKIPFLDKTDDIILTLSVKQIFEDIVKYSANFTTISLADVNIDKDTIYISYHTIIPKDTLPNAHWIKKNEATLEHCDTENKTVLSIQDYYAIFSASNKRTYTQLTSPAKTRAS